MASAFSPAWAVSLWLVSGSSTQWLRRSSAAVRCDSATEHAPASSAAATSARRATKLVAAELIGDPQALLLLARAPPLTAGQEGAQPEHVVREEAQARAPFDPEDEQARRRHPAGAGVQAVA